MKSLTIRPAARKQKLPTLPHLLYEVGWRVLAAHNLPMGADNRGAYLTGARRALRRLDQMLEAMGGEL